MSEGMPLSGSSQPHARIPSAGRSLVSEAARANVAGGQSFAAEIPWLPQNREDS